MRKGSWLVGLFLLIVAAGVALNYPDIVRYLRMREM